MSDMKTKRIFVLVFALALSIASVFTVAAASDDVLIENFQANYSKNADLQTSNSGTGTMTGMFEFGGFWNGDRAMTTIIASNVHGCSAYVSWEGKDGGSDYGDDNLDGSGNPNIYKVAVTGKLWEATQKVTHTATITRYTVSKSRSIIATR